MKNLIYLTIVLPILLFSCKSNPVASFSVDTDQPEVGQKVFFNNNSDNAKRFEWDFGDGYISNEENPVHIYTATGPYEVTLTAISKHGLDDVAKLSLNVLIPTLLEIEVREYYEEYAVSDASAILYSTITDWDDETNPVSEGITDENGIVVFSNLDSFVYYVDVWEQNHDNYTLRSEDIGFVRTPEILPHQINRFIAWVDVASHSKGNRPGTRSMIINKFERKASTKRQPSNDYSSEDWQQLYDRSVGRK
jgi:PKD repeat protein